MRRRRGDQGAVRGRESHLLPDRRKTRNFCLGGMDKKLPLKFLIWIEARKKFHLSNAQIQMARELGLNPKGFGKIANHKQEPWKLPLGEFIEEL